MTAISKINDIDILERLYNKLTSDPRKLNFGNGRLVAINTVFGYI